MSRFRDELLAAAGRFLEEPSAEANTELCGALEGFLRTRDAVRDRDDPFPGECDGVVLWEVLNVEGEVLEFPGFSWLASSQMVTPVRARFWDGEKGPEFEVRFSISGLQVSQDELDKLRYRDALPGWDSDWGACFRS